MEASVVFTFRNETNGKHATDLATARHVISEQHWKRIFGSSVIFLVQDQHIHQSTSLKNMLAKLNFLHFSNSLVNMLAKSLVNMLAEALVNMLAEALVNMLAKALVNMLAKSLVNMLTEAQVNIHTYMLFESLVNKLA